MSLRPIAPVSRRADWRLIPSLWNRDTFEPYEVTDCTLGLALFRQGDDCGAGIGWSCWWRDYGWWRPWPEMPAYRADTSDGSGAILPIPGDGTRCTIAIPQSVIAGLPEGTYRVSIVAANPYDGSFLEVLSELVTLSGPAFASPNPAPLTGDSGVAGNTADLAVNATAPTVSQT